MAGKLADNKEVAYLSYQLATIKTDVELELTCEQLEVQEPAADELLGLFRKYEFKRWTADVEAGKWLQAKGAKPAAKPKETIVVDAEEQAEEEAIALSFDNYETILEESRLVARIEKLKKRQYLLSIPKRTALITLRPIWWVCHSRRSRVAAYVPVAHDYLDAPEQISRERALELLKPILEDEKALKVGQNLKYDRGILQNYGIDLRGIAFDTMLESYILDSVAGRHDMDSLSDRWLKHKTITFEEIAGKGKIS